MDFEKKLKLFLFCCFVLICFVRATKGFWLQFHCAPKSRQRLFTSVRQTNYKQRPHL